MGLENAADEKGAAEYRATELGDFFDGEPVQHREVMGNESQKFLDLFPNISYEEGDTVSGFGQRLSTIGPAAQRQTASSRRCYVGNLSHRTSWQELKDHCRQAGVVVFSRVEEAGTGRYGIVKFAIAVEAAEAIQRLHGSELKGRPILVREDRRRSAERRQRTAGGCGAPGGAGGL